MNITLMYLLQKSIIRLGDSLYIQMLWKMIMSYLSMPQNSPTENSHTFPK